LKILVAIFGEVRAWTISDEGVARLRALAPDADVVHARTPAQVLQGVVDVDVAFSWRIDAEALSRATRLRWIQTPAAGIGPALLSDALRRSDVVLTNSRGLNAPAVAEHALALTLALARRLHTAIVRQTAAVWAQNELTVPALRLLQGLTLGVVGLGTIGTAVARLGRAFGMQVVATRRRVDRPAPDVDRVYTPDRIDQLLAESDVIVLAAPETRETAHLIGARELASMKRDALLVNVGRGGLVDEPALVSALAEGRLGGAGLDVFADEPLPPSSALWRLPNVIVTPHVAGLRPDYWQVAVDIFVDNLRRFEAGEPLLNVVDKDAGY
jgi:phosphoglycerate dehydrogenase-like enzyme